MPSYLQTINMCLKLIIISKKVFPKSLLFSNDLLLFKMQKNTARKHLYGHILIIYILVYIFINAHCPNLELSTNSLTRKYTNLKKLIFFIIVATPCEFDFGISFRDFNCEVMIDTFKQIA